jgi:tetratricopeptide (TPR) repeat protein
MMHDIEIQKNGSYATPTSTVIAPPTERQDVFEPNMDSFKDLYFRGLFKDLINAIDSMDVKRLSATSYFRMNLMKINALFEMHQVSEAQELIKSLGQISSENLDSPEFAHMMARLKYLDNDYDTAGQLWNELLTRADAEAFRSKALIGIANVLYSQERWEQVTPLIEELALLKTGRSKDEELSFLMLKGNLYTASGTNLDAARECFNQVISQAVLNGWYYFLARSLYGLACVAQKSDNLTTLRVHNELLDAVLKDSDNLLLKHLVNKRFHANGFVCSQDVDVDYESKRIRLNDKWFDFHKTPKLFEFFSVLYGSNSFVTKDAIARALWPHEIYKPRSHDPRIFNIAKRVREIIEAYENQPIVILSGRFGYKLAVRPEA